LAENGTPSILTMPKGGGEHQDKEWISKKSLVQFYKILINFLKEL
jgi:di/tripeptidase